MKTTCHFNYPSTSNKITINKEIMKTYTFLNTENNNIKISIDAIDIEEAMELLDVTVKYFKEWTLKSVI